MYTQAAQPIANRDKLQNVGAQSCKENPEDSWDDCIFAYMKAKNINQM